MISCQKPDLINNQPRDPNRPTKCVGGGCKVNFEITITADGKFERDPNVDKFHDPTLDKPNTGSSLKDWLLAFISSPTSAPNPDFKPDTVSPNDGVGAEHDGSVGGDLTVTRPTNTDDLSETGVGPKDRKFKDSDLVKGLDRLSINAGLVAGEITGANQKKRREAKRINQKISEALTIRDQVVLLVNEMNKDSQSIIGTAKALADTNQYSSTSEAFSTTKSFAEEHNTRLGKVYSDLDEISGEVEVPPAKPIYDTQDLKSIEQARAYSGYVARQVETLPEGVRESGRALVKAGNSALDRSEEAYRSGKKPEGDFAKEVGIACLDAALGFVPGVGFAKDVYEATTGVSLLKGEKLSTFERSMAVVGILTAGYGSKLAIAAKAGAIFSVLKTSAKEAEAVGEIAEVVGKAERFVEDAASLKRFGPLEKGPLHEIPAGSGTVADTFRSSSYYEVVTKQETKLYRVHNVGEDGQALGSYWSRTKPSGPLQAQLDSALDPSWGNKATAWVEIDAPAGTKFYEGAVSPTFLESSGSRIPVGSLYGGGSQVYFDGIKVPEAWISARGIF